MATHPSGVRCVMQLTTLGAMERKSFAEMDCSVAQCLEVVGEWWSMLIVRDAFFGVTRFDDFQRRPRDLAQRAAPAARPPGRRPACSTRSRTPSARRAPSTA